MTSKQHSVSRVYLACIRWKPRRYLVAPVSQVFSHVRAIDLCTCIGRLTHVRDMRIQRIQSNGAASSGYRRDTDLIQPYTRARLSPFPLFLRKERKRNMGAGKPSDAAKRRERMPVVAEFVDMCRAAYGADLVNRQMAIAQQARRDYAHVLATQGEAAAARWHKANAHRCTFHGQENGHEVGMPSPYGQDIQEGQS